MLYEHCLLFEVNLIHMTFREFSLLSYEGEWFSLYRQTFIKLLRPKPTPETSYKANVPKKMGNAQRKIGIIN